MEIAARAGLKTPNLTRIRRRLLKIFKKLENPKGEISILLTGDAEMKKLNSRYRGKRKTTDVLSFPSGDGPGPKVIGDIVISAPKARRQAKSIGSSFEREVLFLIVHGLLHLLGYDHEKSEKDAGKMEEMQRVLMKTAYIK